MVKAIVGANWGDEGKGKITDMLAEQSDVVIRFQGGANAGHTIINDYGRFALHILPSGAFYPHITNIIGNGVALDAAKLVAELKSITDQGVPAPNLIVSERAQLLMPYHVLQDSYEEDLKQLRNYPYEIRALRAYFHFELLKRYNSIILGKHSFTKEEVNDLKPVSYAEAVGWIVSECDAVIPVLPTTYSGSYYGEVGRVTRGMAQALKARVLLYAASPLNNPGNDKLPYLKAALAAKELIDSDIYELIDEQTTNNASAQGLIFGKLCPLSSNFETANFPIGYEGGNSGVCPSQNLAEAFDMRNGKSFNCNDVGHWRNQLNASMRDPRFAKTLLYNGAQFKDQYIQSYIGGRNGQPLDGASPTSYYLYKHIQEETSFVAGNETYFQHVYPLFRYAEVFLNYAEALSAATRDALFTGTIDVDGKPVEFTLSPLKALNAVRTRYGMPALTSVINYESFEDRLRRERRVELAFEGHRFWDLRRWKIGSQTTRIYGLEITNSNGVISFTRKLIQERIWQDKMYFYPIAQTERYNNRNLIQNIGWN